MSVPQMTVVTSDFDRISEYKTAAAQTIAVGQPVALNASGLVEKATASSASLLGVAASAVSGSSLNDTVYVHDNPRARFLISAKDADDVDQTIVGDTCDLHVATDVFTADVGVTSTEVLRIQAIADNFQPLADGVPIQGSDLAGDFLPGWKERGRLLVSIEKHALNV
jgi:hypothetical protein